VNRRKPRVQTSVVSRYPTPALIDDSVLLFLPPCGTHLIPLATGSLESSLLVSPLLRGPARHRPFAPTLHLHQRKSSRNLHLQYLAKSQSTPRCQSLITARSDHPLVLGCSGPHHRRHGRRGECKLAGDASKSTEEQPNPPALALSRAAGDDVRRWRATASRSPRPPRMSQRRSCRRRCASLGATALDPPGARSWRCAPDPLGRPAPAALAPLAAHLLEPPWGRGARRRTTT
jgi:hypothetical protein